MKTKLFVYGTLLPGFRNYHLMEEAQLLWANVRTVDDGALYLFRDRPYVQFDRPLYPIVGHIYQVGEDLLEQLDSLERHPTWYCRRSRHFSVTGSEAGKVEAHCYELVGCPREEGAELQEVGCYRTAMEGYQGPSAVENEL